MKYRLFNTLCGIIASTFAGCGGELSRPGDKPGKLLTEEFKSGEVVQLIFTSDGKGLVAMHEFKAYGRQSMEHTRARRFATPDWKMTADTGELSIHEPFFAASASGPWILQGMRFRRPPAVNVPSHTGRAAAPPYPDGAAILQVDPVTLEMKEIDVARRDENNRIFFTSAIAVDSAGALAVIQMSKFGGPLLPPYTFDPKIANKKAELANFPICSDERPPERLDGDPDNNFVHTLPLLEFTNDDAYIISFQPCKPYPVQMREAKTGKLVRSLATDSKYAIGAMKFSPDGKILAGLCWNGDVLIMAADLSKTIGKLKVAGSDKPLGQHAIAFVGNDRLAVISGRKKVELFDAKEWKVVATFDVEGNRANCVAGSPDGKLLAVGFGETTRDPGIVRVWDITTGKLVVELK